MSYIVAPLAGAWIEMWWQSIYGYAGRVAPLAGAWIEISAILLNRSCSLSLPLRERGLKYLLPHSVIHPYGSLPLRERGLKYGRVYRAGNVIPVAPLAGAWIEIFWRNYVQRIKVVAPLAGAWIEIVPASYILLNCSSLPLRERGLK